MLEKTQEILYRFHIDSSGRNGDDHSANCNLMAEAQKEIAAVKKLEDAVTLLREINSIDTYVGMMKYLFENRERINAVI